MYWLVLLILIFYILYYISTRRYNYWKKKNVPYPNPTPLLGNYTQALFLKKSLGETLRYICNKFPNEAYIGTYFGTKPVFVPKDPEIIKLVVMKDFYYFNSRELADYVHKEPVFSNLFGNYGNDWKILRQNLTPLFSSAKMKNMFYLIQRCCYTFEKVLDEELSMSQELDVKDLMERFTIECIGACVFGVQAKTMEENSTINPFKKAKTDLALESKLNAVKRMLRGIWPGIFYGLGFKAFNDEVTLLNKIVQAVFEDRNYKSSSRHDFVDLILGWKENSHIVGDNIANLKTGGNEKVQLKVDDDLLFAQCFVFFAAGFETSAMTSVFTLYELAKHEKALERVLKEVDAYMAKKNNVINYDGLHELPYLEACVDETLRLYPVLGVITREVIEDYHFSNDLILEKGLIVHLPVDYVHRDPKLWPQPEVYRPERFYLEEKHKIKSCSYMPFGEGPRICIGMRFAKMQMLAGLLTIFKKYRLELADNTSKNIELKPESFTITPKNKIRIKFTPRDGWEDKIYAKTED